MSVLSCKHKAAASPYQVVWIQQVKRPVALWPGSLGHPFSPGNIRIGGFRSAEQCKLVPKTGVQPVLS
jgi:hypothetical protein